LGQSCACENETVRYGSWSRKWSQMAEGVPSGKLSRNGKLLTKSVTYELCTHKMLC